jgi:hypothetical protein
MVGALVTKNICDLKKGITFLVGFFYLTYGIHNPHQQKKPPLVPCVFPQLHDLAHELTNTKHTTSFMVTNIFAPSFNTKNVQ